MKSKYDVLTLHREYDNKCVVRLRGFSNLVFWKEIRLVDRWYNIRSCRERIFNAQHKARNKAEKLRRQDELSAFEYQSLDRG